MAYIDINQLFGDISHPQWTADLLAGRSHYKTIPSQFPLVDWTESLDAHVFKATLPGVRKEAVKLNVVDRRILEISGERKKEEEGVMKYHRAERFTGKFLRRFPLPENVKIDETKASMFNGLLTVTVPKPSLPHIQIESESESESEPEPESEPDLQPQSHPEPESDLQPQTHPHLDPLISEYVLVNSDCHGESQGYAHILI